MIDEVAVGLGIAGVGGGGGSTGGRGAAAFVGDSGGSGGNGGTLSISSSGTLTTYNDGAIGLLSQSVGGGGGNGGNAAGIFVAVGGQGGLGGSGGAIDLSLGTASGSVGAISTSGDFAAGVLAHSVGGGGGNGGYAKSVGLFVSNAIGGAGGGGGSGGAVNFTNSGQPLTTSGNGAHGVLLQSIGGGGGNGGGALSHSVGVIFSASMALGGSGGSGGAGGSLSATSSGAITTSSPDAMGLVAQSIGGGGGNAGSALAKSFAAAGDPDFPTVEFSTAVGGKGGSGGAGGTVNVSSTGALTTAGSSAFGLLAQSIGGGGGNGADSTAGGTLAGGKAGGLQLNTAIGGSGGTASGGGSVSVANASTGATISTSGNNATALLAQSIGGGGGNGSGGNANSAAPNLAAAGVSAGFVLAISTAVGGSGGGGGGGGGVTVSNLGTITTSGSSAQGLLAQSIGGGGGNGGGGSAAGGGGVVNVNVSVGGKGGSGGGAGSVSVTNSGSISTGQTIPASQTGSLGYPVTTGGDGVGILAQSIGGGGGVGGSSDPAGGVSNAALLENLLAGTTPLAYAATLNIGGSGGSGGGGGSVSVSNSGNVQSLGVRAHGVLAQSIGGGGGSGGSVVTQPGTIGNNINADINQWVAPTISANIGLGGSGGVGGSGDSVTITNSANVVTAGYGAIGALAQSIGGGGGTGADGSTGMGISIQLGGNGGSGNNGGTLQLGTSSTPLTGTIATIGDDAHGVLAQSIGGGGGWASGICSNSASSGFGGLSATRCIGNTSVSATVVPWSPGGALSLNMPGSTGNSGDGGAVNVNLNGAIQTVGERSMGLVAQSIGGGGGFVSGGWNTIANASMLTSQIGQSYASGGAMAVTLGSSGSIKTSGDGAWGLLAQSIGGGGGFLGDPSLALLTPVSNSVPFVSNKDNHYANGGTVTLNLAGSITTTGSNAHGVVAQSIGGGGGIAGGYRYDPNAQVVMGNAYQFNNSTGGTSYSGGGNSISINQTGGTINTSGDGSIGILAQSTGGITSSDVNPYLINISIAGTVSGGKRGGAGILVTGGGNTSSKPNTITVNSGGLITSADGVLGTAIQANSGYTNVTINSGGTVTGSVDLGATPGDITTNAGGTFNAGFNVVVAANTFTNAGNLFPAGNTRIGTTTITGGFANTASGVIGVDIDTLAPQASDQLIVNGQAQLGGTIVPLATTLLPGSLPVVSATSLSGTVQVRNGVAFGWTPSVSNNTLSITPQPNFRPTGLGISPSQRSLTSYLDRAWSQSDLALAPTFGYLSQLSTGTQYLQVLQAMAPQAHTVQLQNLLNTAPFSLGSSIDCPADLSSSVSQTQAGCVWVRGAGTWASQSAKDGDPGSSLTGASTWLGGLLELAPGWFFGGAFGYGQSWANASNFSSHGEAYNGSLTLRRVHKAWSFSGSLAMGSGSFDNTRNYSLPSAGTLSGASGTYTSQVSTWLIGGRLRTAYSFPLNGFYLRPYLDLDLLHARMPGFSESGSEGLPLTFSASQKTAFLVSPMLEFGGQRQLNADTFLRPYLALGLNIRPDFNWAMNSSFRDNSGGTGSFQLYGNAPELLARLNIGLQLIRTNGFDVRLEYDLAAGDGYVSQVASARFTYRF